MTSNERKVLRVITKIQPDEGCVMHYDFDLGLFFNKELTKSVKMPFDKVKTREILINLSNYGYLTYIGKNRAIIHHHAYHTRELFWQRIGEFLLKSVLVPILVACASSLFTLWLTGIWPKG